MADATDARAAARRADVNRSHADAPAASYDAIVIGAGVAGLTAALGLAGAHGRRVALVTKTATLVGGSSLYAQGGLAAAVGDGDTPSDHAADTISVAGGIAVPDVVAALTAEGPAVVERLLALGTPFDRDPDGHLLLGREAAHSQRRILHADGDATGGAIVRTLAAAVVAQTGAVELTRHAAYALDVVHGAVAGVRVVGPDGRARDLRSPAVVLATGGIGHLFMNTTNPPENTGDGLAMAARAGALLADLEFVQFHPTALAAPGADPLPLLTEALRGEGAVLLDDRGHRFMVDEHPLAELAPRDIVARAIWRRNAAGHTVFIDARVAVGARFPTRFPTVFRLCQAHGIDPRTEIVPVAPAAHYHMGGIAVDARGRSTLPGLWAAGEVTSTGVHGANRLASNSLLEAIAFGGHVADDIARGGAGEWPTLATLANTQGMSTAATVLATAVTAGAPTTAHPRAPANDAAAARALAAADVAERSTASPMHVAERPASPPLDVAARTAAIRRTAWNDVGLIRDADGLARAERVFAHEAADLAAAFDPVTDPNVDPAFDRAESAAFARREADRGDAIGADPEGLFARLEAANLALVGRLVAATAYARDESRGAHFRVDHPELDDARWARRQFARLDGDAVAVDVAAHAPVSA
ncbi:MAG: FAD-binding protein [Ardenticatenales bacterium]